MFQAMWIDLGLTSSWGMPADYGAGEGAGMWQVTTPSVFLGAEQAYDQMVGDAWSRAGQPSSGVAPSDPPSPGTVRAEIWVNCEATESAGTVTLGQCAAPFQVFGSMTADFQRIYNIYSNTLFGMIQRGNRRPGSGLSNARLNNMQSWFNNYFSCNQQAGYLGMCLNASGPSGWTYTVQGVDPVFGTYIHYITVATPTSKGNPTIYMDPWLNQINVVP